ncbi:hypothetical protein ACQKI4_21430, partial [Paenibacillus glucanolyticus]
MMNFRRKSDDKLYALVIHSLIRSALKDGDFLQSYRQLAVQLFPFFENAIRRKEVSVSSKRLDELGRYLITLDEEDQVVATCVSVAATAQAILFCSG